MQAKIARLRALNALNDALIDLKVALMLIEGDRPRYMALDAEASPGEGHWVTLDPNKNNAGDGGKGSGNFNHSGRPGLVGGSGPGGSMGEIHAAITKNNKAKMSKLYQSDPKFRNVVDVANIFAEGGFKEIKQAQFDIRDGKEVTAKLRGLLNPLSYHKAKFKGMDVRGTQADLKDAVQDFEEAIKTAPETTEPIFRGSTRFLRHIPVLNEKGEEVLDKYGFPETEEQWSGDFPKAGEVIRMDSATSFSKDEREAVKFANGYETGRRGYTSPEYIPIYYEIEPGAKALDISSFSPWRQKEYVTMGKFEVVDVKVKNEPLSSVYLRATKWNDGLRDSYYVKLRQVPDDDDRETVMAYDSDFSIDGGPTSGNYGHAGRPGKVGGSAKSSSGSSGSAKRKAWEKEVASMRKSFDAKKPIEKLMIMYEFGYYGHNEESRVEEALLNPEILKQDAEEYWAIIKSNGKPGIEGDRYEIQNEGKRGTPDALLKDRLEAFQKELECGPEKAEEMEEAFASYTTGEDEEFTKDKQGLVEEYLRTAKPYKGTVYRGMQFGSDEELEAFIKDVKPGAVIGGMEGKLTSWTSRKMVAMGFGGGSNRGVMIECVQNKTGVPIAKVSHYQTENEVLTLPGTKWTVMNVQEQRQEIPFGEGHHFTYVNYHIRVLERSAEAGDDD